MRSAEAIDTLTGIAEPAGEASTRVVRRRRLLYAVITTVLAAIIAIAVVGGLTDLDTVGVDSRRERAVADGQFHIYAISHAFEGIALLTGVEAGSEDDYGNYRPDTVMGRVQRTLEAFQRSSRAQPRPLGRS